MSIFTFNPSPSPNIAFGPIAFRVPHASPHRLSHTSPRTRPRFSSPSPTLSPIVAHASPYLRSRFLLPSPTLPHTVAHAFPHLPSRFPSHRPLFLLPSPTLPPTVTHASPHRHPRFPLPSPKLSPTVAQASPHRHPRFPPPSPTLPPTVAHASPHRRPRFPPPSPTLPPTVAHASPTVAHASPHRRPPPLWPTPTVAHACPPIALTSPTLGGEVWRAGLGAGEGVVTRSLWGVEGCVVSSTHPSLSCTDLLSSLAPTPHAWQVVVRLWSRVFGAQPGQRVQAGSKECSAAGGGRPPLPLPSSLLPSLCLTTLFTLSVARPPFLPSFFPAILPLLSSLDPVPLPLSISHSPAPFLTPTLLLRSTLLPSPLYPAALFPLIRPSSHPPILSSAHHLIRPSSHRRPRFCLSAFPCSLSCTHASSRSPFRPSSVSPLLIFCLRAFFVPHPPSEFVVRVCAGLPCIQ
ncbi:unnamed protein product [Closterium sp. NIES-64]|nr:unnamed protein product [Closterium sp. NIES-64]